MHHQTGPGYGDTLPADEWSLQLYVTDWNPRCIQAYRNLKKICRDNIGGRCNIEVVDLLENPKIAREQQIVAVPTLIKTSPGPQRTLIGDFSKTDDVLRALDVKRFIQG